MHKGPYTITVLTKRGRRNVFQRKTFKAAENCLTMFADESVQAQWITNGQGFVYSRLAKGEPVPVMRS
jgi:hypothetical protein